LKELFKNPVKILADVTVYRDEFKNIHDPYSSYSSVKFDDMGLCLGNYDKMAFRNSSKYRDVKMKGGAFTLAVLHLQH
jgi:hypothetical protein